MISYIKDILYPKKCFGCKKNGTFLCTKCLRPALYNIPICYCCKSSSTDFYVHERCSGKYYFNQVILLAHYRYKHIKNIIKAGKYHNKKDVLIDLGEYLWQQILSHIPALNNEYILVPVPLHYRKKWFRWYNQSDVIAKWISNITGITINNKCIKRVKYTWQQSQKKYNDRLQNIQNSFKINKKYTDNIDKKKVVIIDDVISTGATVDQIASLFHVLWCKNISVACIASD